MPFLNVLGDQMQLSSYKRIFHQIIYFLDAGKPGFPVVASAHRQQQTGGAASIGVGWDMFRYAASGVSPP